MEKSEKVIIECFSKHLEDLSIKDEIKAGSKWEDFLKVPLFIDSYARIDEVLFFIEINKKFNITVDEDLFFRCKTVGDIVKLIIKQSKIKGV